MNSPLVRLAKNQEIPCIIPCYRESIAESGSLQTATTAILVSYAIQQNPRVTEEPRESRALLGVDLGVQGPWG
jgi:hypothetical protein